MANPTVFFTLTEAQFDADRRNLARGIMQRAIARISGARAPEYCLARQPSGRPLITFQSGESSDLFVSLSHSGNHLACAVTSLGPVGIDIEEVRRVRRFEKISAFAFGPEEQERCRLEGGPGFYRIWTLREAISKATGAGLSLVADRSDRVAVGPSQGEWRAGEWELYHLPASANLFLSIALHPISPIKGRVKWVEYSDEPT